MQAVFAAQGEQEECLQCGLKRLLGRPCLNAGIYTDNEKLMLPPLPSLVSACNRSLRGEATRRHCWP